MRRSRSSISGARTDTNSCRSYRVRTTTDSSPTSSARRNDPPASLLSEDSTYSTHFERGPMSKTLDRIAELGLDLPEIAAPAGAYVPALRTGNYVYTSGQLPVVDGKLPVTGHLGTDVDVDTGYQLARTEIGRASCRERVEVSGVARGGE